LAVVSFVLLASLLGVGGASAQERFSLSLGAIDAERDREAWELGFELNLPRQRWGFVPQVGAHVTSDESFFVLAAARRPIRLGESGWSLEPSLGVTYYEKGDGKDLGHELEFRSGVDLLRRLPKWGLVGLGVYHLSNARLADHNPGTNSLLLRWLLGRRP
jgi:hypothetical protein